MLSPNIYSIQLVLEWIICLLLTGLIWTVQLVHYPSFQFIEKDSFVEFEKFHQRKISILVIPLMILEVLLSFYNLFNSKLGLIYQISFTALVLIWLSTFTLSVPLHNRLSKAYDPKAISNLINSNWPRTILWTTRSLILGSLLMKG